MHIRVRFRPRRQEDREVQVDGDTVGDLLAAVGEPADVVLVVRDGTPIPESTPLVDGEELLLLSAASGG